MKYLLKIILLGCVFLYANNFYSQAGAQCAEEFIYDCFDPDNYHQPSLADTSYENYLCKTWSSGTFDCPGTYYMAIYVDPPYGEVVTYVTFETTCPGNVNVEILSGEQIENILRTFPAAQLAQLSVDEIREGKIPVFIRFTCYENGQCEVTFKAHCDEDTSDELSPFDPIGGILLLLFPDPDN